MKLERNFDILDQNVVMHNHEASLSIKRNGRWENFSTNQYKENVDLFSYGLLALGFQKGEKILTISNNRPEWNFVDLGMGQIGVIHVPVYPNIGDDETRYILGHSDAKIIIVSSKEYFKRIKTLAADISKIEKIYTFDKVKGAPHWTEILEAGKKEQKKFEAELPKIKESISKDDLLSIIYTSGTTGRSKGVMLTHFNFMSNVQATQLLLPVNPKERWLSFLPMCHVLERMVNYLVQSMGLDVYYVESIDTLGENMNECHPHGFASVPRVLEKLYDKITLKAKELHGIKRSIFDWAVDLGLRYEDDPAKRNGWYNLQLSLARKLVFSKWHEALGGNLRVVISGGASLQPRLAKIFSAAGIKLAQGYGLTETSPVISVNWDEYPHMQAGSVGPIIENVEVQIAEDGEILMKGPNLMVGYYKDPERTKEVIDEDGWFHTGDIGKIENGVLWITDRKKEIFKLTTGKYVAPQIVENLFKESPLIEQILVVGEGEKFAAAIISPNFHYLHGWCFKNNIKFRNNQDLIHHPKVLQRYQEEVDHINEGLGHHQQVKKFALTCREWTTETGELSPTLKLKRNYLKKLYGLKLDYIYGYSDEFGDIGLPEEADPAK
ncbi:MAG: long-chain fatty acid--CoA ligase [Bacteroidales bacterium]|nr:long-chain fatty acid--CoA ligase [Bacteroidales bacterium]